MDKKQERLNAMSAPLLDWYDANKRDLPWRGTKDPYRIWVSEIMLQQTRVAAVLPYYSRWMEALPTVEALAAVDEEKLMKLWQGLGYYSRARNLRKAAGIIAAEYGGRFPESREELLQLPGIGEYTAGAIASIAFGQSVPAVDGNVLRVASRVAEIRENILDSAVKKDFQRRMEQAVPAQRSGEFNQALMDLGATVCLPNGLPLCESCPLQDLCEARRLGIQNELPVRTKKTKRRVEELTVYLLLRDGEIAVRKRPEEGLLAGLWEFPHVSGTLKEAEAAVPLAAWGLSALDWQEKLQAKHIFTHVEWHMIGYVLEVRGEGAPLTWADRATLDTLAVPSAFTKYLQRAAELLQMRE